MKSFSSLLIFMFLYSFLFAQDVIEVDTTKMPNNFIKIFKNFRYESLPDLVFDGPEFNYFVERQDLFGSGVGLAFSHTNDNGNFWEIGLAEMMFSGSNETTTYIEVDTLLYQNYRQQSYTRRDFFGHLAYGITLGEGETGKWRMTAAAAIMPFLQSIDVQSADDQSLNVAANIVGVSIAAYPAIQFKIFKKGYLDISLPIRVLRAAAFTGDSSNPFLNLRERQQSTADVDFVPSIYELRLGLSVGL